MSDYWIYNLMDILHTGFADAVLNVYYGFLLIVYSIF